MPRTLWSFAAIGLLSVPAWARPDAPNGGDVFVFDDGDAIATAGSDNFVVHYTTAGTHAVANANVDADANSVPDSVDAILSTYEDVRAAYINAGFRPVLDDADTLQNGGDARFDVYLVDFARAADGHFSAEQCTVDGGTRCSGYIAQENDFAGYGYPSSSYANRLLASHEYFHAVQAAYDSSQGAAFAEGTAVWASELFDPAFTDLENFGDAYLDSTSTSLDFGGGGPVDAFTYGTAVFFAFLADRTFDALPRLLEGTADGTPWLDVLDAIDVPFTTEFPAFAADMLAQHEDALAIEPGALPFFEDSLRSFVASFRTFCFETAGRDAIRVMARGDAIDLDGVVLNVIGDAGVVSVPLQDGATYTSPGPQACIQVINTRKRGDGARPAVCVGDDDEVATCIAALDPPTPDGDNADSDSDDDDAPSGCTSIAPAPFSGLLLALWRKKRRPLRGQV